jgi:hypothetical protein
MKKIIFSLSLLFAFMNSYSQKTEVLEKNNFGAKLGLNYSSLGNSDTTGKANVLLCLYGNFDLNGKITLQPEIQYTTFGGEYAYDGSFNNSGFVTNYRYSQTISASSINIPIILKFKVDEKFGIHFGPQIGFLTSNSSKFNLKYNDIPVELTSTFNFSDSQIKLYYTGGDINLTTDFKERKTLFSIDIGADYQLNENFFIEGRYNYGLTDFVGNGNVLAAKDSSGFVADAKYNQVNFKNSNFQLAIGFKF